MKTTLVPFTREMLPEAAALLAERHARTRTVLGNLPERFAQPEIAAGAIGALLEDGGAGGYAAFRQGTMVAYLLGATTVQAWGRCGWVHLPGSALEEGGSPEMLQDLYVLLGEDWVRRGAFIHHTYFSAAERDLVEAWFAMDFGKERVDGLLDLRQAVLPAARPVSGILIRRAGPQDGPHLAGMSGQIAREYEQAPFWHPTPPEAWKELREGWAELAGDDKVTAWLALDGDQAVGTIAAWQEEEQATGMLIPPKTFTFSVAATRPAYRGRGIGTALTLACLAHGRESGYDYCYTNWISPNLSASRFWPRFGFQEVAYRLTKNVNPMIAWTRSAGEAGGS